MGLVITECRNNGHDSLLLMCAQQAASQDDLHHAGADVSQNGQLQ